MRNIKNDKRAWIRIVEAFVAVLLVAGAILVILDKGYIGKTDISKEIYEKQDAMLREIQLNDTLRGNILGVGTLPMYWNNLNFPGGVKGKITNDLPSYLICNAQICEISDACMLQKTLEKDIYVRGVIIASAQGSYDARQLKMFCWMKD